MIFKFIFQKINDFRKKKKEYPEIDWKRVLEASFDWLKNDKIVFVLERDDELRTFKCFEEFKAALSVEEWDKVERAWRIIVKNLECLRAVWYKDGRIALLYDFAMPTKKFSKLMNLCRKNCYVKIGSFIYVWIEDD